jgi:hypothetical protein
MDPFVLATLLSVTRLLLVTVWWTGLASRRAQVRDVARLLEIAGPGSTVVDRQDGRSLVIMSDRGHR